MSEPILKISSISELHALLGLPKPKHPLISLIDTSQFEVTAAQVGHKVIIDFYMISLKDKSCGAEYGRNQLDFDEGVMAYAAPGQVYTHTREVKKGEITGWMLYFHADLIRKTHLSHVVEEYSFFNYETYEALHLSEEEEQLVNSCAANIEAEYNQRIDGLSQRVIVSNLELLLNYSLRFYERQFHTRTNQSKDVVVQFERTLKSYMQGDQLLEGGLPPIQYFAEQAHLSQHYFSDLIKKETGRSPKDHINEQVVERAKTLLLTTGQSVSEIAYTLGFNYPHYFTRLFKSKTGHTPVAYRQLN